MIPALAFDEAPPYSVPLRFFLAAPLFGLAAALLLAWQGPQAFASRWTPEVLALTHLVALGFVTMVMAGALLQLLPVLSGRALPAGRVIAPALHAALIAGTVFLVFGFLSGTGIALRAGAALLAAGLTSFAIAGLLGLLRARAGGPTLIGIGIAFAALLAVAALGAALAHALAGGSTAPVGLLVDLHVGWSSGGWVLVLVTAVAFRVVPMFQVTPAYPRFIERGLALLVLAALAAWSAARFLGTDAPGAQRVAEIALGGAAAALAAATLLLQARRLRRLPDLTVSFWRLGMASLAAVSAAWIAARIWPELSAARSYPLVLGMLFLVGFAMSVEIGMLYRIVPFLTWLHRARLAPGAPLPRTRHGRGPFALHLAASLLLPAAAIWPEPLTRIAAFALGLSSLAVLAVIGRHVLFSRRSLRASARTGLA